MVSGRAQYELEVQEGAARALSDFASGVTVNPFTLVGGWRGTAWDLQYTRLVCLRDDDPSKCCWQHKRHLMRWNKSHWGITSCPICVEAADVARALVAVPEE